MRRIEDTVRRIEQGDRDVRTDIDRVDELGHVAHALDELTERLDGLERERTRFEDERAAMLSSVSHDLRTPIAALQAAVEALADGIAPDPQRYLASMQRDIDALASLVDDLFLLVRLDSGRYEMPATSIDLAEIADEAIEALDADGRRARASTVALDAPGAVWVTGNAAALGRVIRNLLDNAIRHAPPGSTVDVAVQADGPRIRVSDAGPGFPDAFADHAFDHFTRADSSRNRGTGGAGLGLAIARGVVEAHGGRIWIEIAARRPRRLRTARRLTVDRPTPRRQRTPRRAAARLAAAGPESCRSNSSPSITVMAVSASVRRCRAGPSKNSVNQTIQASTSWSTTDL